MPLPAGIDALAPSDSAGLDEADAQAGGESTGVGEEFRGTVLVVDDEPDITQMLGEYLSIQGFTVTTAGSGPEALERLGVDQPDAILLDVRMPGMDGIETLRQLKARGASARVLMVSANDDVVLAKLAIELGAFDYLLKPVDFGYLSRALDQIMSRSAAAPSSQGSEVGSSDEPTVSCYDLALDVCHLARGMRPEAKRTAAWPLQRLALLLVRHGPGASRRTLMRYLNDVRTLLRFAKDLGDVTDEDHRRLESMVVRARRGLGMS